MPPRPSAAPLPAGRVPAALAVPGRAIGRLSLRARAIALLTVGAVWGLVVLVASFPDLVKQGLQELGVDVWARDERLGTVTAPWGADLATVAGAAWAGLGAVYLVWAALALGSRLCDVARLSRPGAAGERLVAAALGLGAVAGLMALMALAGVMTRTGVAGLMAVLGAHAALWSAPRARGWAHAARARAVALRAAPGRAGLVAAGALAALFLAVGLIGALGPEVEFDAAWYHVWFAQQHLAAGHLVDAPQEFVSLYPQTGELLFAWGLTWGGPIAAKLVHLAAGVLLAGATYTLARRFLSRGWAVLAVALLVSAPTVTWELTTAYVDLLPALFGVLALIELLAWREAGDRARLVRAALLLGLALATKHLALLFLPGAVLVVALGAMRLRRTAGGSRESALRAAVRPSLLFTGLALLVPAPWYARSFAATGDPVFPTLYGLFGAPADRWSARSEAGLARFMDHFGPDRSIGSLLELPWTVTTQPDRFDGSFGPIFLILVPLALLALRRRPAGLGAAALFAGAYLVLWASPVSSFQARFLVLAIPVLAVLAAVGLAELCRVARSAGMRRAAAAAPVAVGLVLLLNLPVFMPWHGRVVIDAPGFEAGWINAVSRDLDVAAAVDADAADARLARLLPGYRAVRAANELLPAGTRVVTDVQGVHMYSRDALITLESPLLWNALQRTGGPGRDWTPALDALGVRAAMVLEGGELEELLRLDGAPPLYRDGRAAVYRLPGPAAA